MDYAWGVSSQWQKTLLKAVCICALGHGIWLNSWKGIRLIQASYHQRTKPLIATLEQSDAKIITVQHQWIAQEIAALMMHKGVILVRHHNAHQAYSYLNKQQRQAVLHVSYVWQKPISWPEHSSVIFTNESFVVRKTE